MEVTEVRTKSLKPFIFFSSATQNLFFLFKKANKKMGLAHFVLGLIGLNVWIFEI
jgi:hypothetical protein